MSDPTRRLTFMSKRKRNSPKAKAKGSEDTEYKPTSDPDTLAELEREARQLAKAVGPEAMKQLAITFALAAEEEIRKIPNHPSLPLLEEYYRNNPK